MVTAETHCSVKVALTTSFTGVEMLMSCTIAVKL